MSRKRKLKGLARNSRKKKKGEKMAFIAKLKVHFAHMRPIIYGAPALFKCHCRKQCLVTGQPYTCCPKGVGAAHLCIHQQVFF